MRSIMEDIYFGNITDWTTGRPQDPEYDRIKREIGNIEEHFRKFIPLEEQKRFEELELLLNKAGTLEDIYLFKCGMCFSMLLMMDIYDFLEKERG